MILPAAEWRDREGMTALLAALGAERGDTRFVGGCVRDGLLGLGVSDVDLATRIAPQDVLKRLRADAIKAVPTGIAHGTVTAVQADGPVEITTLRRDIATDGRRATIAYTDDWQEDAARRDFTINALSADPATGEVFDYFGGLADLEARAVRFIGDPLTRIAEDHLRILRFFRFHARFGDGPADAAGLAACAARANDLMALSRERIADELLKLLALPCPSASLKLMVDQGILRPVLPEITPVGVDRLGALVAREDQAGVEANALRRLTALLPADPAIAASVAGRLRLSRKSLLRLVAAASATPSDPADPFALAYAIGTSETIDRLLLGGEDMAAVAPKLSALSTWERPRLSVGGGDLIAMGLKPGPLVAATLQAIEREWAETSFHPDPDQQRQLARRHVNQALRDLQ